ncbi:MAG: hypothetical protein AAGA18_15075 [Verrucomicrobiota bacterium]
MGATFPANLVMYELALDSAFQELLEGTIESMPDIQQQQIEDAYFKRLAPLDFAAQCLNEAQWKAEAEDRSNRGRGEESKEITEDLTGELF